MERRLLLAIGLMIVVAVLPSLFLKQQPRRPAARSAVVAASESAAARPSVPQSITPVAPLARPPVAAPAPATVVAAAMDTATLVSPRARYRFSALGASLTSAELPDFRSFGVGRPGPVNLVRPGDRLLSYRVVVGSDTVRFDSVAFRLSHERERLAFAGTQGA